MCKYMLHFKPPSFAICILICINVHFLHEITTQTQIQPTFHSPNHMLMSQVNICASINDLTNNNNNNGDSISSSG